MNYLIEIQILIMNCILNIEIQRYDVKIREKSLQRKDAEYAKNLKIGMFLAGLPRRITVDNWLT